MWYLNVWWLLLVVAYVGYGGGLLPFCAYNDWYSNMVRSYILRTGRVVVFTPCTAYAVGTVWYYMIFPGCELSRCDLEKKSRNKNGTNPKSKASVYGDEQRMPRRGLWNPLKKAASTRDTFSVAGSITIGTFFPIAHRNLTLSALTCRSQDISAAIRFFSHLKQNEAYSCVLKTSLRQSVMSLDAINPIRSTPSPPRTSLHHDNQTSESFYQNDLPAMLHNYLMDWPVRL